LFHVVVRGVTISSPTKRSVLDFGFYKTKFQIAKLWVVWDFWGV
jgi:hypothetical protein